ncbi:MAG: hypothetical protein N2442_09425 [Spirochaetes bacterium]|nr:hypothetical protein [Spirochaetota bacterium]
MKKLVIGIALIMVLASTGVFAQFAQLESDFSKLMLLLGREVMPFVQQNDLAGTGIGVASLEGDFFYVALTAGAVVSDGILKFVDSNNTEFTTLDVYGLLDDNIPSSGIGRDLYDKSKEIFPFPTLKLALGLRLIGLDFIFTGIGVPGGIVSTDDLEASLMNFGIRVRKDILKEKGWFPTISLGVGYVYSGIHFKYTLTEFTQDYSGQDLKISGGLSLDTRVHSFGFDVGISRTLLILTPFLRTSLWYQNALYETKGSLKAQLGTATPQNFSPSAKVTINDWAVMFAGGLDINLFLLQLCATGTYNPSTKGWGAELSLRFGF